MSIDLTTSIKRTIWCTSLKEGQSYPDVEVIDQTLLPH